MGPHLPRHNLHFRYHFPHQQRPGRAALPRNPLPFALVLLLVPLRTQGTGPAPEVTAPPPRAVRVALLCDRASVQDCASSMDVMDQRVQAVGDGTSLVARIALNVSVVPVDGDSPATLRNIMQALQPNASGAADLPDVLVAVGGAPVVQLATIVGQGVDRPVIGYVTDGQASLRTPLVEDIYLSANTDPYSQGATLALLIGSYNMPHTYILIQDIYLGDGFLAGFRSMVDPRHPDIFMKSTVGSNVSSENLKFLMEDIAVKGWKIIVLHCEPRLTVRVVAMSLAMNLFSAGYGWFLSEKATSVDPDILRGLPDGLLGLHGFNRNGTRGVLSAAALSIGCAYECMQECDDPSVSSVPFSVVSSTSFSHPSPSSSSFSSSSPSSSSPPWSSSNSDESTSTLLSNSFSPSLSSLVSASLWESVSLSTESAESRTFYADFPPLADKFRVSCNNPTQYFTQCVRYSPLCRQPLEYASESSVNSSTTRTTSVLHQGSAFHLLNLISTGDGNRLWENVGYIAASGQTDLKTVLWPGHTIFSPSSVSLKTYRVVTRPARPFVFMEGPVESVEDCFVNVPCLMLKNSTQHHVIEAVDDFVSRTKRDDMDYRIFCCKGISLEILGQLASDLNFEYVIYFVNDTDYGTYSNGAWSGMVGDVVSGAADMIVGAFSMTSGRMQAISFTEPFYQNEFSMVTGQDGRSPSMWAFLSPFSAQVWTCILLSSIVAGVATSVLEWFSPFGLNPRGRKRQKQYSLGSGLLMVWVLVTGHTINVKAPKSWPSKVIQNVWAGLAIFIMTSYTANLAAYLAGQSAVISVKSIFDSKLLQKRVSVIKSSAVEAFLAKVNPDLYRTVRTSDVNSTEDAILALRTHETDVYLDDTPLLEFSVSRLDKDCKVRFVGKGFGSDGYAIGLSKHSWMRVPMSNHILSYVESGFVQDLSRKYLSRPHCEYFLAGSAVQYGLEHTGGLFIILLSAMFLSVFFLFLEHLAYRFLVPWFRSRPEGSFWKTENLAFISQRVHRVVRSERLYSQKQAAQEMIKIVKQRDFTRLIQKNELQKRKVIPQKKRVKTKAEMFQEITANIVSYHRQLNKELDPMYMGRTAEADEGTVTFGAGATQDPNGFHVQMPSSPLQENHIGVSNLAFFQDDEHAASGVDESVTRCDLTDEDDQENESEEGTRRGAEDTFDEGSELGLPSPKRSSRSSRSSVSSTWSSPRRKLSSASAKDKPPAIVVTGTCCSEPTSPEGRHPRFSWGGGGGSAAAPTSNGTRKGPGNSFSRRVSDVSPMRTSLSITPLQNNVPRSRSQDYQSYDYFQKNMKLKDNRVKSTLRRHAMSGYQSQMPVEYLDECTLEALSKEDLVILWKKSELELQTKLTDVMNRNKRLAMAIDYLTKQEFNDVSEEV